jgi:hypothetical protein
MKGGKKSTSSSTSGAAAGPKPVVVVLAGLPGSGFAPPAQYPTLLTIYYLFYIYCLLYLLFLSLFLKINKSNRKSTFATELERTSGEMWVRVSQDDLGSADEVKKQMEKVPPQRTGDSTTAALVTTEPHALFHTCPGHQAKEERDRGPV